MGDETLKQIAVEITDKLRASTTVDWQVRESVRSRERPPLTRVSHSNRPAGMGTPQGRPPERSEPSGFAG